MKKPAQVYTERSRSGFTLVELLVVVAILAVLAVIGFTVFTGVQTRGNDARRLSDLDNIAKALEVNKTSEGYQPLADEHFANGQIPTDPGRGSGVQQYCIKSDTSSTGQINNANAWTGNCPSGWDVVAVGKPAAKSTRWKVCVLLQDNSTVRCKGHSQ